MLCWQLAPVCRRLLSLSPTQCTTYTHTCMLSAVRVSVDAVAQFSVHALLLLLKIDFFYFYKGFPYIGINVSVAMFSSASSCPSWPIYKNIYNIVQIYSSLTLKKVLKYVCMYVFKISFTVENDFILGITWRPTSHHRGRSWTKTPKRWKRNTSFMQLLKSFYKRGNPKKISQIA